MLGTIWNQMVQHMREYPKRLLILLNFLILFFCTAVSFSNEAIYYSEEAHFSLRIPRDLVELTPRYSAHLDDQLLSRGLLPSQVYYDKLRDYDVAFLGFDNLDTINQRKTILGIEIGRHEHIVHFHKPYVRIFLDNKEVETLRRRVAKEIRAEEAQDIQKGDLVIDKERFYYYFSFKYSFPDESRVEEFWAGFLGKIHAVFLHLEILNPPEDLDCHALFTDLVASFNFDPMYRYSKVYGTIRILGESLLTLMLVVLIFLAIPRIAGVIQRIYLKRKGEIPMTAGKPPPLRGVRPEVSVEETFQVKVHVRLSEFFPSEIISGTEVEKSLKKLRQRLLEEIKKNRTVVPY